MAETEKLEKAIQSLLKSSNKLINYEEVAEHIKRIPLTEANIRWMPLLEQIRFDLAGSDDNLRDCVLKFWAVMTEHVLYYFIYTCGLTKDFIDSIYVTNTKHEMFSIEEKKQILRIYLEAAIIKNDFHPSYVFRNCSSAIMKKIGEEVISVAETLPKNIPTNFLIKSIVPSMFSKLTNESYRGVILQIAFGLIPIAPISILPPQDIRNFKKELRTVHFKDAESFCPRPPSNTTEKPQHTVDSNWPRLCIFVPKYLGTYMHDDVELINGLLRLVESAFRSKNTDYISSAYDCWMELLDNYKLNWEYLCGSRQIKLLIKPLKIQLSKSEQIMWKRFDLWLALMQALQTKACCCLEEYLRFCFSPFHEVSSDESQKKLNNVTINPTKVYKNLWPKITDALIGLLGHHGHGNGTECDSVDDASIWLIPLISNEVMFFKYNKILIASVVECCILLQEWCPLARRKKIVHCLWTSLFYLTFKMNDTNQCVEVLKFLCCQLSYVVQKIEKNPDYMKHFLNYVMKTLGDGMIGFLKNQFYEITCTELIFPLVLKLINIEQPLSDEFMESVMVVIEQPKSETSNYFTNIYEYFFSKQAQHYNLFKSNTFSKLMWNCLAKYIINFTKDKITPQNLFTNEEEMICFLLYPLDFKENGEKVYIPNWYHCAEIIFNLNSKIFTTVLKELKKFVNTSPENVRQIYNFFPVLDNYLKKFDNQEPEDESLLLIINEILTLIVLCGGIPSVGINCDKLGRMVCSLKTCVDILVCKKDMGINDSIAQKLQDAFQLFIVERKMYMQLMTLEKLLASQKSSERSRYVSNQLTQQLSELVFNSDATIKKTAFKVCSLLQTTQLPTKTSPGAKVTSRAAKIVSMAQETNNSIPKPSADISLFGKDLNSSTPTRLRGSILNNASPSSSNQKKVLVHVGPLKSSKKPNYNIDDDSSGQYVLIDTKVNFDPKNLTEKQKEATGRRRDDIPALYNDLSQSQTAFSGSNSNSQSAPSQPEVVSTPKRSGRWEKIVNAMQAQSPDNENGKKTSTENKSSTSKDSAEEAKKTDHGLTKKSSNGLSPTTSAESGTKINPSDNEEPCINDFISSLKRRKNVINDIRSGIQRNEISFPDDVGKVMAEHYMSLSEGKLEDKSETSTSESTLCEKPEAPTSSASKTDSFHFDVDEKEGKHKSPSRKASEKTKSSKEKLSSVVQQESSKNGDAEKIIPETQNTPIPDKVQQALKKLTMDIVGGDEIVKNMNTSARLRTRKSNVTPKVESQADQKNKKSLPAKSSPDPKKQLSSGQEMSMKKRGPKKLSYDKTDLQSQSLITNFMKPDVENSPKSKTRKKKSKEVELQPVVEGQLENRTNNQNSTNIDKENLSKPSIEISTDLSQRKENTPCEGLNTNGTVDLQNSENDIGESSSNIHGNESLDIIPLTEDILADKKSPSSKSSNNTPRKKNGNVLAPINSSVKKISDSDLPKEPILKSAEKLQLSNVAAKDFIINRKKVVDQVVSKADRLSGAVILETQHQMEKMSETSYSQDKELLKTPGDIAKRKSGRQKKDLSKTKSIVENTTNPTPNQSPIVEKVQSSFNVNLVLDVSVPPKEDTETKRKQGRQKMRKDNQNPLEGKLILTPRRTSLRKHSTGENLQRSNSVSLTNEENSSMEPKNHKLNNREDTLNEKNERTEMVPIQNVDHQTNSNELSSLRSNQQQINSPSKSPEKIDNVTRRKRGRQKQLVQTIISPSSDPQSDIPGNKLLSNMESPVSVENVAKIDSPHNPSTENSVRKRGRPKQLVQNINSPSNDSQSDIPSDKLLSNIESPVSVENVAKVDSPHNSSTEITENSASERGQPKQFVQNINILSSDSQSDVPRDKLISNMESPVSVENMTKTDSPHNSSTETRENCVIKRGRPPKNSTSPGKPVIGENKLKMEKSLRGKNIFPEESLESDLPASNFDINCRKKHVKSRKRKFSEESEKDIIDVPLIVTPQMFSTILEVDTSYITKKQKLNSSQADEVSYNGESSDEVPPHISKTSSIDLEENVDITLVSENDISSTKDISSIDNIQDSEKKQSNNIQSISPVKQLVEGSSYSTVSVETEDDRNMENHTLLEKNDESSLPKTIGQDSVIDTVEKICQFESEDIIESSQDTSVDAHVSYNLSEIMKRRGRRSSNKLNKKSITVQNPGEKKASVKIPNECDETSSNMVENQENDLNTGAEVLKTNMCDLETQSVLEQNETLSLNPASQLNIEESFCERDTESILEGDEPEPSLDYNTRVLGNEPTPENQPLSSENIYSPKQSSSILPGSPVTGDTPNRNSELVTSTCNISPIKNVGIQTTGLTPVNLFNEDEEVEEPKSSTTSTGMPESDWKPHIQESDFEAKSINETRPKKGFSPIGKKQPTSRSAKMMNLLPNAPSISDIRPTRQKAKTKTSNGGPVTSVSSPQTERIRKMMMCMAPEDRPKPVSCDVLFTTEIEQNSDDDNDVDMLEDIPDIDEKDILEFKRELPKSSDTPKCSILKRKAPDSIDDGLSPCAKRKRVNFSDPPTSCKKVFFSDPDEHTPFKIMKKKQMFKFVEGSISPAKSVTDGKKSIRKELFEDNTVITESDFTSVANDGKENETIREIIGISFEKVPDEVLEIDSTNVDNHQIGEKEEKFEECNSSHEFKTSNDELIATPAQDGGTSSSEEINDCPITEESTKVVEEEKGNSSSQQEEKTEVSCDRNNLITNDPNYKATNISPTRIKISSIISLPKIELEQTYQQNFEALRSHYAGLPRETFIKILSEILTQEDLLAIMELKKLSSIVNSSH